VDIQCPVHAIFGVFKTEPLSSNELHQMIGRCRKVGSTHIYIPVREQYRPIDADLIYRRHAKNAAETGKLCEFNAHGILDMLPAQQTLLRLFSRIEAERNQSKNHLSPHFQASAASYRITRVAGSSEPTRQALKEARRQVDEETKQRILTAVPVDDKTFAQIRVMTREIQEGHERFTIENCVGIKPITAQIYDDFHILAGREQLERFTDLIDDEKLLKEFDREEAHINEPANQRSHHALWYQLLSEALTMVFDQDWYTVGRVVPKDEVEQRLALCLAADTANLSRQFARRADASQELVPILRWLLKQVGLLLQSGQVSREGIRVRGYSINTESLLKMRNYADARLEHLKLERMDSGGNTQNAE
jgi:hypothetical protein